MPDIPASRSAAAKTAEGVRLAATADVAWRDWGPYLSERAWGTVREDYSAGGDAWDSFPHDHARSRVYRWNEDGMAGFSDESQTWCLSLALWNGVDPILKERMFGLTGPQGNHGEDVKEYWWYLDGTPTHSWNTWRYHYPQREFPYGDLVAENARRGKLEPEYELVDTGVFAEDRYWSVTVDYAKEGPHDLLMNITVENAGPEEATIHVLPTLWFRNIWSWGYPENDKPVLRAEGGRIVGEHSRSGPLVLTGDGSAEALFCDNETNTERLYGSPGSPYPKDGINDHVLHGAQTVNPDQVGTKAALHYVLTVPAGGSARVRVRLVGAATLGVDTPAEALANTPVDVAKDFDRILERRRNEADKFYDATIPAAQDSEEYRVARQAFAGLLWGKQFYHYDVARWLTGDPGNPPPPPGRGDVRNGRWQNLNSHDVILMPDPWEYPWFAAWDLAFHCVTLAHIDPAFAKDQLLLLLREWYMHPGGQLPAYEWDFSDVNPPVHAWAAIRVFEIDGRTDFDFLARVFHKLLINFTWWVNSKDRERDNLFEGGFMGLDNISPLDRSSLTPDVGYLEQADSTGWMAMYAIDLLDIALRLALHDSAYEDIATKFLEHFLAIATAANSGIMWDDEDAFYYDVFHRADGVDLPVKVKSLVGLVPLRASLAYDIDLVGDALPGFRERGLWWLGNHPGDASLFHTRDIDGVRHRLLALIPPDRLVRLLGNLFDESGLLGPYGIRSISAWHRDHPFSLQVGDQVATVDYEPAESTTNLFGGNSNWRGPVWMPLNVMLVEALRDYDKLSPEEFAVEYPAGSGVTQPLRDSADDIARRLISMFLPGEDGRRPVHGWYDLLATDPRWKDNLPFHEYFHGDTGMGLGAEHQTGWTALVAHLVMTTPAASSASKRKDASK
ncbi:MGH1-like glycoside hydrolase domain-containing protein [Microbacterium sp. B2969]|uniref:MGH1-like glycoside hydrolase domain-containing protein n=1 Tax=Microbacterium alkaliflavum TaxID=3248839 RepID=A0ABW7Q2V1_9MICO